MADNVEEPVFGSDEKVASIFVSIEPTDAVWGGHDWALQHGRIHPRKFEDTPSKIGRK